MLTINLQQIVEEINARRNRIRYPFQELGILLTQKLSDPRHKALYMKIAKNEEQELIMDALHYVTASSEASGNLGALFMWKLKELKSRPIHPIDIRLEAEGGHFKIGTISSVTRGDMPLLVAALNDFSAEIKLEEGISSAEPFLQLPQFIGNYLKDFRKKGIVQMKAKWEWVGSHVWQKGEKVKGVLKLGAPVLTKRAVTGRMPSS
ncbi:MAG: hypothetical protein ACOYT9_02805 [Patescibacteria group bacterium]